MASYNNSFLNQFCFNAKKIISFFAAIDVNANKTRNSYETHKNIFEMFNCLKRSGEKKTFQTNKKTSFEMTTKMSRTKKSGNFVDVAMIVNAVINCTTKQVQIRQISNHVKDCEFLSILGHF